MPFILLYTIFIFGIDDFSIICFIIKKINVCINNIIYIII